MNDQKLGLSASQRLYGEIVYWVTIVAALLCLVGPLVAMANVERNVLNPHYLFAAIFDGKSPEEVWKAGGGEFPGGTSGPAIWASGTV
jgi:hypothetical protein